MSGPAQTPRAATSTGFVLESAGVGAVLLAIGALAAHPLSSPDTFWHLKLGEIIVRSGSIPRTDLFSAVNPDRPWVQFGWLWEVIAYELDAHFGLRGLRIAQALLMIASFAVLYFAMRRARGPALASLLCACALAVFVDRFQARPDAPNLLLATLAAPFVLGFRRVRASSIAAFAALALFWVNLHAGTSLLLGGVTLAVLIGSLLNLALGSGPDRSGETARSAVRCAALLFGIWLGALIVCPNALTAIAHFSSAIAPIATAREPEWSPSLVLLRYGHHPGLALAAFAPYAIGASYTLELRRRARAGREAIDCAELVPCIALLALAALVTRNLFVCLLPLATVLMRARPSPRAARGAVLLAIAIAALVFDLAGRDAYGGLERARVAFAHDLAPGAYPEHAAEFMRRAGLRGNVLNFPRWGDYLIERLFPSCRVFFDSRRDVTPEMLALLDDLARPDRRDRALERAFTRFGIELVVYEAPLFASYQPEAPWQLVYKAGPEEVYQHARGPNARANLERARRQFARLGIALPENPESPQRIAAITRAGSEEWLRDPWQQLLLREQTRAGASGESSARQRATRSTGLLLFRAGAYPRAAELLREALDRDPTDASARYHLAFALFANGERDVALALARATPRSLVTALTPAQRYRFGHLLELARGVP